MSSQENSSYQQQDIDVLQFNHFKSLAERILTKAQYQKQIQKSYNHFNDIRTKQKFINQLKLFYELKSIDQEQLKARKFDFNQYSQFLVNKAELFYKIHIKKERTQSNRQNYLRNQLSLQYWQKFFNFQICNQPLRYSLQTLLEVKNEIITRLIDKKCNQIRANIKRQRQKGYLALQKRSNLQVLLKQKRKSNNILQKQILNLKEKATSSALYKQNKQMVQIQILKCQLKDLSSFISKKQNLQETELTNKISILKERQQILKHAYEQLQQQYKSINGMSGHSKRNIPNSKIVKDHQMESMELQLQQLNLEYVQIKFFKKLSKLKP